MHRTLILDKPKAIILLLLCILGINIFAEENYPVNFVLDKDTVFQGTTFKSGSKIYLRERYRPFDYNPNPFKGKSDSVQ